MSSYSEPLLAKGSPNLVHLDLRLPYTCARKLVRSAHWTHLNHGDLKQPASHPPREHMRLYIPECADWIIEVRARPIYGWDYVTVEDILEALHNELDRPVEHDRWARDSVNPRHAERVKKACSWRVAMLNDKKLVSYEDARQRGLLRVDYLGSRCLVFWVHNGVRW
ncbi:hypothetical protein DFH11DRAFT_1727586 [Phellopilus nigrolimitatus]|nr:hypothetical protein DFH11DRAFT_1727586 [Phellopilus nigrolimitatus]